MAERKRDYPTGNDNGMSFISNRWVFTGAEGYRVLPDRDDPHLFVVVRYNAASTTGFYGGRGLTEEAAHTLAASLAGTSVHPASGQTHA
jgi:hypothetical protein